MPNVVLTDAMKDYAERQIKAGVYANMSEVVRAGMRRLMQDDGAAEFYRLREEIRNAMDEPADEVDLRELLLSDRDESEADKAS